LTSASTHPRVREMEVTIPLPHLRARYPVTGPPLWRVSERVSASFPNLCAGAGPALEIVIPGRVQNEQCGREPVRKHQAGGHV